MKSLTTFSIAYMMLALIAAASLAPLAYTFFVVILLLLNAYYLYLPPRPGLRLTATLLSVLLIPCALQSALGALLAAIVIIPALPYLDSVIRGYAESRTLTGSATRRRPTATAIILFTAVLLIMLTSVALMNRALTYAGAILIVYLAILIGLVLWKGQVAPVSVSSSRIRVVAGDTATSEVAIAATGRLSLLVSLDTASSWIRLKPWGTRLVKSKTVYVAQITPPLAGPDLPALHAHITDPWGLIRVTQVIRPFEIFVIPRAAYAAWLAKKYLEQYTSGPAAASTVASIPERYKGMMKGVEYQQSRPYQPGDRMKDIDWKHSIKFRELITKEYREGSERTAIIAANLDARDAEQADILAYSLITSALTMAMEHIPTALSVYNHNGVLEVTRAENPRHILVKALNLAQSIGIHQDGKRYLASPDISRLRRLISQVKNLESIPAQNLAGILSSEYDALQQAASTHPATIALSEVARHVAPPAVIALLSLSADDSEALAVSLYYLKRKGYDYFYIKNPAGGSD